MAVKMPRIIGMPKIFAAVSWQRTNRASQVHIPYSRNNPRHRGILDMTESDDG